MADYDQMSKAELISRLSALERSSADAISKHNEMLSTQQKVSQKALADSEERMRAILETAVEGIITIDERGLIESMNPAAEKTFGYQASEVIGKNVSILMPTPYRQEHDGYLRNYARTGQARIIGIGREVTAQRKDGTTFPIELSVSEVRLADRRLFTGFVRDITERKRLEKQILEISDREQGRIGQDLHDGLCQQLAGIELISQVLEQKLEAKSRADAAQARDIAKYVREAISHTRSLARGLFPVTLESEGLKSGLEELCAGMEKMFGISCSLDCRLPVVLQDHIVATHLFRIAQEAVSNAIKHGKARSVVIQLKQQGNTIVLVIRDDGTGFPEVLPNQKGMGLHIMQSRAGMIGGTLAVGNATEGGGLVTCRVTFGSPSQPIQNENSRKENSKSQKAGPHR
jgi:two-component system, LuxR family, sensor kinase FixL